MKVRGQSILICLLFLFVSQAEARVWEKVTVPGAKCGHGGKYNAFVSRANSKKWAVVLQGGGACWDFLTCSTSISTRMFTRNKVEEKYAILSSDATESPIYDYSVVYFPYCTGDLFAGDHTVKYASFIKSYHWGHKNLKLGMEYLKNTRMVDIKEGNEVLLYGASAGGLGMVLNMPWILQDYVSPSAKISVIADGMGLHWHSYVWKRFRPERILELQELFGKLNVPFTVDDGLLAKYVNIVCDQYPDIRFGILQGSMDITMSVLFGFMNPLDHRGKVYGANGIYEKTIRPNDNCAAWVPDSFKHTFANGYSPLPATRTKTGMNAMGFIREVMSGVDVPSLVKNKITSEWSL